MFLILAYYTMMQKDCVVWIFTLNFITVIARKRCENSEGSSEGDKKEKKGKLMTKDKKRTLKRL